MLRQLHGVLREDVQQTRIRRNCFEIHQLLRVSKKRYEHRDPKLHEIRYSSRTWRNCNELRGHFHNFGWRLHRMDPIVYVHSKMANIHGLHSVLDHHNHRQLQSEQAVLSPLGSEQRVHSPLPLLRRNDPIRWPSCSLDAKSGTGFEQPKPECENGICQLLRTS